MVLNEFPLPVAVRYQAMLEATSPENRTRRGIGVFEVGLRLLALGILGQYVQHDMDDLNDKRLNQLAFGLFRRPTSLGTWNDIFFTALKAYGGHRDRFFIKPLYDFYWDASDEPHKPREGIQRPFQRLVEVRNIANHAAPSDTAGWQSLAEEADSLLHEILAQFHFVQDYDLIYIVKQIEQGHIYDVYTGQQVKRVVAPLSRAEPLQEEWCYLSRQSGELLVLHPLVILWENELRTEARAPEIVVYDAFQGHKEKLSYWSTSGRVELQDSILVGLIKLIFQKLEEIARPQRVIRRLHRADLQYLAKQVVHQRMEDARGKYDARVYLQRKETRDDFIGFLQSDKTCLVVIGDSGVGKSNFIFSLLDEFKDNPTICALAYNGARLDPAVPLENVFAQDFNLHLKLGGDTTPDGPAVLKLINEMEEPKGQQLLIFVDAINEYPGAKDLLRRIDRLVEN
jgi:hypothetical protein